MQGRGLIQEGFEAQARLRPEALALSSEGRQISYGELDQLACAAAGQILRHDGCGGGVVAVLAERGPALVVGMLACLKAGRPFVVLDLAYPPSRLATLVEICRPTLFLSAGADAQNAMARTLQPRLTVDLECPTSAEASVGSPPDLSPDAPAYLLFTSGSTGVPKCLACSHRPLVNFVDWQARTFALRQDDRFTLLSGLSHDPILRDVFTPLTIGASLHMPAQSTLTAPGGLRAWFDSVRPTAAHMTPPLGQLLTAGGQGAARLDELRYVFWGGDVLRQPLIDALARLAPRCESVNFFGSTETPQAAAFFRATSGTDEGPVPIGVGIDGFEIVVQGAKQPSNSGELGEIVIRSRFLTLGQVVDGHLPPAGDIVTVRTYPTGDLGLRRSDGEVLIAGRRDDQVKVRGYRVEMPEITACALKTAGVGQAVTLNLGDASDVQVCCFVASDGEWTTGLDEAVRARLAAELPAYMVPQLVVELERLPLLPNGKVDRQALIERERSRMAAEVATPVDLSPAEASLVEQWRSIFRHGPVTRGSSFAALGGDSLSYVNAYLALEVVLGAVPENWTTMTVAELARTRPAETPVRRSFLARVESAILLRALAIGAVVASHFGLLMTGGGATSALIWVSGFLFGGLQLHEAEHQSSVRPVLRVLRSVLIPLAVYEAPQLIVKALTHHHFRWSSVFLFVDLLDYTGAAASGPNAYRGHEFVMWYIHCIVHILMLYAVLFALFRYGLKLRRPTVATVVAAVALGLFSRFLMPMLVVPGFWSAPVQPMSFFNHSPTTHLATFALAAMAGYLKGRGRLAVLALALAYAALSLPLFGAIDSVAIGGVAAMLLFAPQVPVPRMLSRAIYTVAGASFFIYLLHLKIFMLLTGRLHMPPLAIWPVAMFGGVLAWSAWNWVAPRIGSWMSRRRISVPWLGRTPTAEPA